MGEKIGVEVLERFPLGPTLYIFVSGLTMLIVSPIRFFLPTWLTYPFALESPTEVASSFLSILLCSLIPGTVLYFLKQPITGNRGLNEFLHHGKRLKSPQGKEKFTAKELGIKRDDFADFIDWSLKTRLYTHLEFLSIQSHLICALIVAGESALILDCCALIWIGIVSDEKLLESILVLITSASIFLCSLRYDKYFKKEIDETLRTMGDYYKVHKKQIQKRQIGNSL